ncbi:MAG: gliding motility-associated C-terminal domain-containing protein [Bacteroidetes bacterium]|nr:gliding motility-associated C-terminal domain-containing protein [Bacteroidota bacterium]
MKSLKNCSFLLFFACLTSFSSYAQDSKISHFNTPVFGNYIFSADSVAGFDEEAAKVAGLGEGLVGQEFKVYMFYKKRNFVNAKYYIKPSLPVVNQRVSVVAPACTNEDFEGSTPGNITTQNQLSGWSVTSGLNQNAGSSCNLGNLVNGPNQSAVVFCNPNTGFIDPIIGGCYPIYSVFGTNSNSGNSVSSNSLLPPMKGNNVIRINNDLADYSAEQLSKTFAVTANNALFQFAFISVFSPNHVCCDAGGLQINLTNASTNSTIPCPSYSISAPGSQCTSTNPVGFFIGGGSCPTNFNGNNSNIFSKWSFNSMDLSAYIGQNITIDIIAVDCVYGGHFGYVYFDAQCSPMTIIGNGSSFPAGSTNINVPTCGASGATLTAPTGLGPYTWTSNQISIPAGYASPSYSNQTLVTNQSGTLSLSMYPAGSCQPITKVITVTITPAPIVVASATQAGCTNTLSAASVTTAGSASVSPIISWSPQPGTLNSSSTTATGLAVGVTTITVFDNIGCQTQATVNILATPPPVTFAVNNVTGSSSITCLTPTINLTATSGYTYGTISYNWASTGFTATGNSVDLTQAGNYNVCGIDAASTCSTCQTFTIGQNTTPPTSSVNPSTQIINCASGGVATFTGTALSPTVNVGHEWYAPGNPPPNGPVSFASAGVTSLYSSAGVVGTFTYIVRNFTNGCIITKTVSVTSTSGFPTFQTSSSTNYSVGCSPLNQTTLCIVNAQSTNSTSVQYAFLPPASTATLPLPSGAFGLQSCTITGTNCNGVPVTLSSNASVNSGTVNGGLAQIIQWVGPSPQGTLVTGAAQYSANVPGDYSLTVKDSYNGCVTTATINIKDLTQPPILATPNASVQTGCGDLANLSVSLSQTLAVWSLYFNEYPAGATFVPSSAIQPVGSPTFAGSTGTVLANLSGDYKYIVTNKLTGCKTIGFFTVSGGKINADLTADPLTGYAPLSVNFVNNSATSTGATSSITSVWSFGNGTSSLTTNPNVNTSYISPGTYTVMMISTRGGCSDTSYKVIKVEIPSKMEVPNVFTPNGDGSNDVFFLKTANLTEITALIYDRWGNKVHEVTSSTGNIGWDGNNTNGKECAAGTYFYIIKATGKDSKAYEQKGTVSLYR